MLKLGEMQTLMIVKKVEFGVYVGENSEAGAGERVLLPAAQVPEGAQVGDTIEVFLYRDSKDRMIATCKVPLLKMGELKVLRVVQTGKMGAFLDWGLEKDLFLPFREQTWKVSEGDECLVSLYLDKSSRLCATMRIYRMLSQDSPYETDDMVWARIYEENETIGMFAAVDDKYSALIPRKECYGDLKLGDRVEARITGIREDGKISLSVRHKAYEQISWDTDRILKLLDSYDGVLPFGEKASPETIRRETGMSKNEFKRAIGHLLKLGEVETGDRSIRRKGR